MKQLILAMFLALGLTSDVALAVPRLTPYQDVECGLKIWGVNVPSRLEHKIERKFKELEAVANRVYGVKPRIVWGYSFDVYRPYLAGTTFSLEGFHLIFFNPVYINKYEEEFIGKVVRHEYAHAVTTHIFGRVKEGHGEEWQSVMRMLGDNNPEKYHSYTYCVEDNGSPKLPIIPSFNI